MTDKLTPLNVAFLIVFPLGVMAIVFLLVSLLDGSLVLQDNGYGPPPKYWREETCGEIGVKYTKDLYFICNDGREYEIWECGHGVRKVEYQNKTLLASS